MDVRDAVLVVLSTLGYATATRIHKLVFLAVVEGGVRAGASFKPYYFGPWSPEVQRALNELVSEGYVVQETGSLTENGYQLRTYRLTENGRREAERVYAKAEREELRRLKRVVIRYGGLPLSLIIAYIYSKYPDYTELSIIREKVEKWRKYYGLG